MRIFIYIFIIQICTLGFLKAQEWKWAINIDFPGTEDQARIRGIDTAGNVYLTVIASSVAHNDSWMHYYLLKLDESGNVLWSKNITEYFQSPMVIHPNGNIYMTYMNKIVCLDASGQKQWETQTEDILRFGEIFDRGDYFIATAAQVAGDSLRSFMARLDLNGKLIEEININTKWSKIAVDHNRIIVASTTWGSVQNGYSTPLMVYDEKGKLKKQWLIPHSATAVYDDSKGNTILTGKFGYTSITIGNNKYRVPPGELNHHHYIVKYDSSGTLLWYKIITGDVGITNLSVDKDGNVYYATAYGTGIHIDDFHREGDGGGLLVVKFDPSGKMSWQKLTASSNSGKFGRFSPSHLFAAENSELFIAGSLYGTLRFGNSLVVGSSNMYNEMLVAKLDHNGATTDLYTKAPETTTIYVRPNPSGDRFLITFPEDHITLLYSVTDITGRIITNIAAPASSTHRELLVDLSSQPNGIYFLSVQTPHGQQVKKLIKN